MFFCVCEVVERESNDAFYLLQVLLRNHLLYDFVVLVRSRVAAVEHVAT